MLKTRSGQIDHLKFTALEGYQEVILATWLGNRKTSWSGAHGIKTGTTLVPTRTLLRVCSLLIAKKGVRCG